MIECVTTGAFLTNSYIISNENKECVIVDPGFGYKQAAAYIKENYKPVAILLTHGHMDHIDGIQYFMDLPIYIHEKDEICLYDSTPSLYDTLGRAALFKEGDLDVRRIHDGDVISLIGYEFKVLHTPGHTRGSVCYSYKDKVLSGDTLFRESCGRTDFPEGNSHDMLLSLRKIMDTYSDSMDVYPGHDAKTTIKNERRNNPYIS